MTQYSGAALAKAIQPLPTIFGAVVPDEGKQRRVACMDVMTAHVGQAILHLNLTQNEVMHALALIMAGTLVMPDKGLQDEDASLLAQGMMDDYVTLLQTQVCGGKAPSHPSNDTVN